MAFWNWCVFMCVCGAVGGWVGKVDHVSIREHRVDFDAFPNKHLETLHFLPFQASDFSSASPSSPNPHPGQLERWSQGFLHCTISSWTQSTQTGQVTSKWTRGFVVFITIFGFVCFHLSQFLSWEMFSKYLLNWAAFVSMPLAYRTVCVFSLNSENTVHVYSFENTQLKSIQNGLESIIHCCLLVSWEEVWLFS